MTRKELDEKTYLQQIDVMSIPMDKGTRPVIKIAYDDPKYPGMNGITADFLVNGETKGSLASLKHVIDGMVKNPENGSWCINEKEVAALWLIVHVPEKKLDAMNEANARATREKDPMVRMCTATPVSTDAVTKLKEVFAKKHPFFPPKA